MNISPINYQPMSVSNNMNQSKSKVNFKSNKIVVRKLPEYLARERATVKADIDSTRSIIKYYKTQQPKDKATFEQIAKLEDDILAKVRKFNNKLNDYMDKMRISGKEASEYHGFYLH